MANQAIRDKDYDLVSVVYHASQGCETCNQYESDADKDGDTAAAEYFAEARRQYEELASKGKELLKERL